MTIETERLLLIPATAEHISTELQDINKFSSLVNAKIPSNWPPADLKDVLPFFLKQLEENPELSNWLCRYCVIKSNSSNMPELMGSIGFLSAPDMDCTIETGYSVLPQYEGRGYATEMLQGIVRWALGQGAKKINARTDMDNTKSQRVLIKAGFSRCDDLTEDGKLMYTFEK